MATDRHKIQGYLEAEISERFTAWKKQRGIEKDSAALNELLKEYFSPAAKTAKIDSAQIEQIVRAEMTAYRFALEATAEATGKNVTRLAESIEVLQVGLRGVEAKLGEIQEQNWGEMIESLDEEVNHLADGNGILDVKVQEIHKELQEVKARLDGHSSDEAPAQLPSTASAADNAIAPAPDDSLNESLSLNQAALSRRLQINPGQVHKKREKLDAAAFGEWSKSKDPDAIAWQYDREKKLYSPVPYERTN